ncbi:MAG: hypothetical protein LBQ64_01295 [Bacteroidales bacterium]|nr:hypothetical protein [Bacteroidales bacterium]
MNKWTSKQDAYLTAYSVGSLSFVSTTCPSLTGCSFHEYSTTYTCCK